MPGNDQSTMRVLQAAACVVVIAWGIKAASHILSIIFIALLLSYVILPFPKWLMRRFHFPKGLAIPLTVAFVAAIYLVVSVALIEASFQLRKKCLCTWNTFEPYTSDSRFSLALMEFTPPSSP